MWGCSQCLLQTEAVVWVCKAQPAGTWYSRFAAGWREDCCKHNPQQTFLGAFTKLQFTIGAQTFILGKPTSNLNGSQISETMSKMLIRD